MLGRCVHTMRLAKLQVACSSFSDNHICYKELLMDEGTFVILLDLTFALCGLVL